MFPVSGAEQFMDSDAPEIDRERRDPFRLVFGEVGERHCAALTLSRRRDRLGDRVAVEGAPLAGGDRLQSVRLLRATEGLTRRRRPALRQTRANSR